MKIKLRASGDVQILTVSELSEASNIDVLRAGITKIFKSGKNKIILELEKAASIPPEVLRELARLRMLSNELSGDIVLAGMDEPTRAKIENFSKPPFISCFASAELALEHFKKPHPELVTETAAAPAAVARSKEAIKAESSSDIGSLRKENERLRAENQSLSELLANKLLEARSAPDAQSYIDKIQILEGQVADYFSKPPAKGA